MKNRKQSDKLDISWKNIQKYTNENKYTEENLYKQVEANYFWERIKNI